MITGRFYETISHSIDQECHHCNEVQLRAHTNISIDSFDSKNRDILPVKDTPECLLNRSTSTFLYLPCLSVIWVVRAQKSKWQQQRSSGWPTNYPST